MCNRTGCRLFDRTTIESGCLDDLRVSVCYLSMGTWGAPYADYLILDPILISRGETMLQLLDFRG